MMSFLGGATGSDSATDAYEEEMVRVVTEMSLMDDFDLEFDSSRLDIVADKLQLYQDLVDQHLATADNICLDGFNQPISDAQIKDIFGIDNVAPPSASEGATESGESDLHGEEMSLGGLESRGAGSEQSAPLTGATRDSQLRRRASESLSSSNIQNLVTTIGGKLRWYQKKIVDQISGNTKGEELKLLLELNDKVAAISTKVSLIVDAEFPTAAVNSTPPAGAGSSRKSSFVGEPNDAEQNIIRESDSNNSTEHEMHATEPSHTAVIAAVFALRRGGDREDTLLAVNNLIKLCHYGGEINKYAAKVMMSAGALQSLLSTLTRSGEWPEVEQQISKLVSVLIVFEDDWVLLQRSALLIISSLYTLRLKTTQQHQVQPLQLQQSTGFNSGYVSGNSSVRTPGQINSSRSRTTSLSTVGTGMLGGGLTASKPALRDVSYILKSGRLECNLEATRRLTRQEVSLPGVTDLSENNAIDCPGNETEKLVRGGDDDHWSLLDENEESPDFLFEEEEDIKTLLSAAIAKLTLVLASDWSKLDMPISSAAEMMSLGPDLREQNFVRSGYGRDILKTGLQGGGVMSVYGALGTSTAQSAAPSAWSSGVSSVGLGTKTHRNSWNINKKNNLENDRILQILLNMINSLCENSLEQLESNGSNSLIGGNLSYKPSLVGIAAARHSLHNKSISNMSAISSNSSTLGSSLAGMDIADYPSSVASQVSVQNTVNTTLSEGKQQGATGRKAKANSIRSKSHPSLEAGAQNNALTAAAAAAVANVSGTAGASNGTSSSSGLPPLMMPVKEVPDFQLSDDEENTPLTVGLHLMDYSGLMKVDSSAVLCSAALANLAAVPQCRAGLVSYGALGMIKSWLLIGVEVLSQARELCFELLPAEKYSCGDISSNASAGQMDNDPATPPQLPYSYSSFMESFGPAYELISNAAEALMYISGGTDCRSTLTTGIGIIGDPNERSQDYMIGWIEAQILSEGLPAVVVKVLQVSLESFSSLLHGDDAACESSNTRRSRSVLPAAVGMHLAQTLYMICRRPGNRQQLQLIDIPFYLCALFENITSHIKVLTKDYDDEYELSPSASPRNSTTPGWKKSAQSIFSYIFHFGGIYSQKSGLHPTAGGGGTAGVQSSKATGTTPSTGSSKNAAGVPLIREASSDFLALYSANIEERQQHRQNLGRITPCNLLRVISNGENGSRNETEDDLRRNAGYGKGFSSSCGRHQGEASPPSLFTKLNSEDLMPIMMSITSSCLDALTYFFVDELAKMIPDGANSTVPNDDSAMHNSHRIPRTAFWMSGLMGHRVPLLDLMCSSQMINAILMSCSYLPRGSGRLSALRLISALTDCPVTLRALYNGSVMDVLVHIASESEENKSDVSQLHPHHKTGGGAVGSNKDSRSSKDLSSNSLKDDLGVNNAAVGCGNQANGGGLTGEAILAPTSLMATIFPPKPATVERGISDGSSVSGMSSSITAAGVPVGGVSPQASGWGANGMFENTDTDDFQDPVTEKKRFMKRVALEETLTVCYALANLCESSEEYATRMFQTGLYSIMLKIVRSRHIEVCRQALRCLEAMCSVINDEILGRALFTDTKRKDGLMLESLDVLSDLLDSPSTPVLRGAMSIIAYIAGINETLQDKVVDGPLKVVLYLLLDPTYHRDFRPPAIRVLKNLGFPGGEQDYELCGFDFEMLRDWYIMKRSLKPQEMAYDIVSEWIEKLFSNQDQDGTRFEDLHYEGGDVGSQGHDLFDEAANILQGSFSVGDLPSMMTTDSDYHGQLHASSIGNLLSGASGAMTGARSSALSIPALQRNITDGLLRLLPFCIKSPFNEAQKSNAAWEWDRSSHAHSGMNVSSHSHHQNSPMMGSGASMNRSSHGGVSSFTSPTTILQQQQQRQYDWIDRPPAGVLRLLDLFYTSKLQQLLLMDLTSLGVAIASPGCDAVGDAIYEFDVDTAEEDDIDLELVYMIPRPLPISAIIMPSRFYTSFSRVGRVIERMLAYSDPLKLWSLTFRDSEFMGDFHTSLLTTLRRCPQICSLSFASSRCVEEDALMGHLVGQIPASVRFLSFKSTISRESIQALCILLRMHNAAFVNYDVDSTGPGPGAGGSGRSLSKRTLSSQGKTYSTPNPSISKDGKESITEATAVNTNVNTARGITRKGLLGLALTHLTFEVSEINCIIELLQCTPRQSYSRSQSFRDRNTESSNHSTSCNSMKQMTTPSTSGAASGGAVPAPVARTETATSDNSNGSTSTTGNRAGISSGTGGGASIPETPRLDRGSQFGPEPSSGLRFLDLSYNALSDQTCAKIMLAATQGPLEGLELAGNPLQRCPLFMESMEIFSVDYMMDHRHRLRHLGLSHCLLTSRTVGAIMEHLLENVTLTSLDLSHNDIDNSAPSNDMLRHFLRTNSGLRSLDLCYNKLNSESYKEMHLGLLENESLLLMPLAGNGGVERNQTIQLIQMKLRQNRAIYKLRCKTDEDPGIAETVLFAEDDTGINGQFSIAATAAAEVSASNNRYGVRLNSPIGKEPATAVSASPNSNAPVVPVDSFETDSERLPQQNCALPQRGNERPTVFDVSTCSDAASVDSQSIVKDIVAYTAGDGKATAETCNDVVSNPLVVDGSQHTVMQLRSSRDAVAKIDGTAPRVEHLDDDNSRIASESSERNIKRDSYYALSEPDRSSTISLEAWSVRIQQRKGFKSAGSASAAASVAAASGAAMATAAATAAQELTSLAAPIVAPIRASNDDSKINSGRPVSMSAIPQLSKLPSLLPPERFGTVGNIPVSPPAEGGRFADNTLNVFFSAPLVGFDRASNPHPLEVLDYSSERDILIQVFKEVHRDVCVHFDFATTDALRTALSLGCKALHFSGHGIPKGLCFEDGRSGLQVIRVPQLKDLLGAGGLNLQFVFVSACYSMEIGEAFVRAGVPHVVCVKLDSKVQDAAAIAFTRAFYVAFLSGKTVQSSFTIAKEALKASPYVPDRLLEGEKFLLLPDYSVIPNSDIGYTHDNSDEALPSANIVHNSAVSATADEWRKATVAGNHDKVLFKGKSISKWPIAGKHCTMGASRRDVQKFLARNRLPAPPSEFEGREVAMHALVRSILERRMVSLVGDDGIGKTSVAAATCKILTDRECFPDSVVFVKCEGLHDYSSFLRSFEQALLTTGSPALVSQMQALHITLKEQQQVLANSKGEDMTRSSDISASAALNTKPFIMQFAGRSSAQHSEEDIILSCMSDRKLLVVLDNLHDLLADFGEAHTDVRMFLNRLFDLCPNVKVLVVSTDTLSMYNITIGFNVVEYSVPLGPLSLYSSLRLFARLAPCLHSVQAKQEFINALLPPKQRHVTVHSTDASPAAKQILAMFGNGHPKKIVHMSSVSTATSVEQLKEAGINIISDGLASQTPSVITSNSYTSFR